MTSSLVALFVLLSLVAINAQSNGAASWERRTLDCRKRSADSLSECTLALRKEEANPAECIHERDENGEMMMACHIHCEGGEDDSVILKNPAGRQECLRHYTYNTQQRHDDWYMWLSEECAHQDVTLSVWCKFPAGFKRS